MTLCGVDEAGRGAALGPMVLAAYMVDSELRDRLRRAGVDDSKTLSRKRREELYELLLELGGRYKTATIPPTRLDAALRRNGGLGINLLEAKMISRLVNSLKPNRVYIDSPDRDTKRFARLVETGLRTRVRIVCENRADSRYVVVSAASVIAKVTRDRQVERLHRIYGDFGSGYPSDPKTVSFIRTCIKSGRIPIIVRSGWATVSRACQVTLDEFRDG
ncbi:MAG: ribonuclease HII [Nitrososphaerota archaeon]